MQRVRSLGCCSLLGVALVAVAAHECRAATIRLRVNVTNTTGYPAMFYLYDGHGNLNCAPFFVPGYGKSPPKDFPSSSGWINVWTESPVIAYHNAPASAEKEAVLEYEMTLRPQADPKEVDFSIMLEEQRGIYRFDDSRLIMCVAGFGEPRPKDFKPDKAAHSEVLVYERESR